jgi:predicted MPP superfamily phosphohydrolase
VYAVTGSPPVDPHDVIALLVDGLPIRWLRNEKVTLDYGGQPVDIVGITCTHRPFIDAPKLDSVLKGKPEHFTILLYHTPDLAPEAAQRGIHLQLSGHTHGGQVRLPFFGALYTASLYHKKLEMGRYQLDGMTLYVSRGLGLEGAGAPRVRFLCPPEATLWEIC